MIGLTNAGGGGSSGGLNLQFVGSLTAPSNPKENMIWVKTDRAITQFLITKSIGAWSVIAGAVEMTYEASNDYTMTGISTLFFNGKLHGTYGQAWFWPTGLYQSDGAKANPKDAYIYKSGTWVQFSWTIVWLYKNGVISDTLGGGMTPVAAHFNDTEGYKPTVTIGTSDIVVSGFKRHSSGAAYFNKPLDLTRWKTLYIRGRISGRDTYHTAFGLQKNTGSLLPMEVQVAQNTNWVETVHKMDVSGLSGMYYLGFGGHQYGESETKCAISEIWVE